VKRCLQVTVSSVGINTYMLYIIHHTIYIYIYIYIYIHTYKLLINIYNETSQRQPLGGGGVFAGESFERWKGHLHVIHHVIVHSIYYILCIVYDTLRYIILYTMHSTVSGLLSKTFYIISLLLRDQHPCLSYPHSMRRRIHVSYEEEDTCWGQTHVYRIHTI